MTGEPRLLARIVIDAIHNDQMATHGGLAGARDESALESVLARSQQALAYGGGADIATLAAAYAYGLARNHPYNDGNKRIAFMAMAVFAELNGYRFEAAEADVAQTMLRLASGGVDEAELAQWVRERLVGMDPYSV